MTPTPTRSSGDAAAIQAQIASARAQLLGGRGADVSQTEIDQHTRARIVLDGEPTSQHLAAVARQTAIAGGDAAAIALDIAAARQHLTATVQATTEWIHDPVSSSRFGARSVDALRRRRAGSAVLAGIAVVTLRKRMRRLRKTV